MFIPVPLHIALTFFLKKSEIMEQVKILLRKPDEWAEEDSRYYHKLFPQYTISIEYEEDEDGISKEGNRVFYHHLQTDTRTQYGVLKIYHYSTQLFSCQITDLRIHPAMLSSGE